MNSPPIGFFVPHANIPMEWRLADAMHLPTGKNSFEAAYLIRTHEIGMNKKWDFSIVITYSIADAEQSTYSLSFSPIHLYKNTLVELVRMRLKSISLVMAIHRLPTHRR